MVGERFSGPLEREKVKEWQMAVPE